MDSEMTVTLELDGQKIGSIHITPNSSSVTNVVSGETIPISERDAKFLGSFFERYILLSAERYVRTEVIKERQSGIL